MERRGFAIIEEGSWGEIVAFGEQVSSALDEAVSSYDRNRFDTWRPKDDEPHEALRERTAEEASMNETRIENASNGTKAEMHDAGKYVKDSGHEMMKGHARNTAEDLGAAGNSAAKGLLPLLIQLVRGVERGIYFHIIGRTNPMYFDGHGFTADIERHRFDRDQYTLQISFNEKEAFEEVCDRLGLTVEA